MLMRENSKEELLQKCVSKEGGKMLKEIHTGTCDDHATSRTLATAKKAAKLLNDIIHRFGLPKSIITNLGSTFTESDFLDFYDERFIAVKYVSVAHPRANSQVERANSIILDALKKRLYEKERKHLGKWLKELLVVVWGLRTQPSRNTGVSPYFMVFGSKAVLPTDVAF
ncbi:uncharacterized protein [Miscanthus floridulus]|uniref:uncharacterized protein n=1 Tax=Miscanthus floridulus TaxID=154761 RepID=UPI003459EAB5